MHLTSSEKILLLLKDYWNVRGPPEEVTQKGIASSIGIRRSHVPRSLKRLIEEGLVEEASGRIRGRGRRVKVYSLTEKGMRRASEISRSVKDEEVILDGEKTTIGQVCEARGLKLLEVLRSTSSNGILLLEEKKIEAEEFLNRKEELSKLKEWFQSKVPLLVVYGPVGIGKTALVREFLKKVDLPVFWRDIQENFEVMDIVRPLSDFLAKMNREKLKECLGGNLDVVLKSLREDLERCGCVLVFDGYFEVKDEVVDFFSNLVQSLEGLTGAKLLIVAQKATPSYCRFYDKRALEKGLVRELHLKGLDLENSKKLLGAEKIEEEALRRIYLLTKGCPLYLELIRKEDAQELKRRSRFTDAEIRLLLFSKDVKGYPRNHNEAKD